MACFENIAPRRMCATGQLSPQAFDVRLNPYNLRGHSSVTYRFFPENLTPLTPLKRFIMLDGTPPQALRNAHRRHPPPPPHSPALIIYPPH